MKSKTQTGWNQTKCVQKLGMKKEGESRGCGFPWLLQALSAAKQLVCSAWAWDLLTMNQSCSGENLEEKRANWTATCGFGAFDTKALVRAEVGASTGSLSSATLSIRSHTLELS